MTTPAFDDELLAAASLRQSIIDGANRIAREHDAHALAHRGRRCKRGCQCGWAQWRNMGSPKDGMMDKEMAAS